MMKVVLVATALFATSNAQPELTTGPDNTLVVRRVAMTSLTDIDVRLAEVVGEARLAASTAAYNATLQATMAMTAAINDLQTNMATQLAGQNAQISTQLAAISTAASTAQVASDATIAALRTELTAATDTAIAEMDTTITDAIAGVTATVNGQLTRQNATAAATTTTLTALVASKADAKPKLWMGGCNRHPGSGWQWYCLDRETYNTAAGYMRKQTNERMVTQRAGYFRTVWYTIKSASGWSHNNFYVNNQLQFHTLMHTAGCWWQDDHMDHMFRANNNFWFAMRAYSPCSHSFHHGGAESGGNGYHSRITHYWVGPLE